MDTNLLTQIILEQQDIIKQLKIVPRQYKFEENVNYVLVGLRRAGKSFMLFKKAQDLIKSGKSWDQIIYINFEDERLADFKLSDFNKIIEAANQITDKTHYYFFDEIQNVAGWERFARRMADQQEHVILTGSNSKMLGKDISLRLGGRYMTKYISTFNFNDYLTARKIPHTKLDLLKTDIKGKINQAATNYLHNGGLPESIWIEDKRNYLTNIYQNVFLADILVRNNIRNHEAMRLLIKKIAETVMHEVSYSKLYKAISSTGISVGKNSIIEYINNAENAYLLFRTQDYFSKFAQKESTPRYYFNDNGILDLFYINKNSALLENLVAITLHNKYQDQLYYLKFAKTKIDIDFYSPQDKIAYQVAWELNDFSKEREIDNLVKLAKSFNEVENFIIVTRSIEQEIQKDGITIHVMPLAKFLLNN